jgi:hypothetical protein
VWDLGLSYNEKYIGDFLVRRDGSSLFGPAHRWNSFYRASGAWLMGEESWFPFKDFSTFKLRYSLGTAGNRPAFTNQYESIDLDASGTTRFLVMEYVEGRPFRVSRVWSRLHLQAADQRLADLREQQHQGLVHLHSGAGLSGYSNVLENAGGITGNTLELTLQGQILSRKNLSWTMLLSSATTRATSSRTTSAVASSTRPTVRTIGARAFALARCGGRCLSPTKPTSARNTRTHTAGSTSTTTLVRRSRGHRQHVA